MTRPYQDITFDIVAAREARARRRQASLKKKQARDALMPHTIRWIKRLRIQAKTREVLRGR